MPTTRYPARRRHDAGVPVRGVPAEQFVGTLAGQGDSHMLRGQLAQRVEAERREISERLVQIPRELLERHGILGDGELELVVLRFQPLGDGARGRQLVSGILREADREGLHRLIHPTRHQRHDQARVEPAGQHRPERHVAHQAERDRLVELVKQPFSGLLERHLLRSRVRIAPEGLNGDSVVDDQPVTRGQLLDSLNRRQWRREVSESQVRIHGIRIDPSDPRRRSQEVT